MKIHLLLCLTFLPLLVFGQNKLVRQEQSKTIDSLTAKLSTAQNDTLKVKLLNGISHEYVYLDANKGIEFGQQALDLAKNLFWEKGGNEALIALGDNYYNKSNFKEALNCYEKAMPFYEKKGNEIGQLKVLLNLGGTWYNLGNYPKALDKYYKALKIAEQQNRSFEMERCLRWVGNIYKSQGDYERAFDNYFKSIKIYNDAKVKSNDAKIEMTLTLEGIGNAYYEQNKSNEAFKYYSDALSMAQVASNQSRIAINLMNIGNVYSDSGNNKKALDYQFKALEIFKSFDDKSGLGNILENIGITYFNIASDTTIETNGEHIPNGKTSNLKLAIEFLHRSIKIVKETGELNILSACYDALSQAYAMQGNYKEALDSKNKYLVIKDSVHSVKNALKIANLEYERETEKRNEEVRYTKLMNKVSVGAVILLLLIVFVVYRSFKTVKKTNKLVAKLVDEQESTIKKRTQELAESNERLAHANTKLLDLIQYNAHNVREPLARLLGAMIVKEYISDEEFHLEIWPLMEKAANDLDKSIKDVISVAEETAGNYVDE